MKTVGGLLHRVENLKQSQRSRLFQRGFQFRGNRRKPDVAASLHCFFKAAKENVNRRAVHLPNFAEIKHDVRSIDTHRAFQFPKKNPSTQHVQRLRELLHVNRCLFHVHFQPLN